MKKLFTTSFFIFSVSTMQAQTKPLEIVGEYYLRGVMETASGFKLNADSTFEFFFSYGALDRQGSGKWNSKNGKIILNSKPATSADFKLIESRKVNDSAITIQLKEQNPTFLQSVLAIIHTEGKKLEEFTDSKGMIKVLGAKVDSLELFFQFAAERSTKITSFNRDHNHFVFQLEQSVMEVHFKDFQLILHTEGLYGLHPLLGDKKYNYQRGR